MRKSILRTDHTYHNCLPEVLTLRILSVLPGGRARKGGLLLSSVRLSELLLQTPSLVLASVQKTPVNPPDPKELKANSFQTVSQI